MENLKYCEFKYRLHFIYKYGNFSQVLSLITLRIFISVFRENYEMIILVSLVFLIKSTGSQNFSDMDGRILKSHEITSYHENQSEKNS